MARRPPRSESSRDPHPFQLVDEHEIARLLRVSVSKIRSDRFSRRPSIPVVRVGRSVRYHPGSVFAAVMGQK